MHVHISISNKYKHLFIYYKLFTESIWWRHIIKVFLDFFFLKHKSETASLLKQVKHWPQKTITEDLQKDLSVTLLSTHYVLPRENVSILNGQNNWTTQFNSGFFFFFRLKLKQEFKACLYWSSKNDVSFYWIRYMYVLRSNISPPLPLSYNAHKQSNIRDSSDVWIQYEAVFAYLSLSTLQSHYTEIFVKFAPEARSPGFPLSASATWPSFSLSS